MRINEIMIAADDVMSRVELAANAIFGGNAEDFTEENVQREHAVLKRLVSGGGAPLYRVLFLTPEQLAGIRPGGRLSLDRGETTNGGVKMPFSSWTTDYKTLTLDALNIDGWDREGQRFFLIKAMVPGNAIDIPASIAQRLELPWENEVCVIKNRPVRLMGMWELAEEPTRAVKVARPDLNSKMMLS